MAKVNPQTFFRFAADHHTLLEELYKHRDGVSEAALLQMIRRYGDSDTPDPHYMMDRLRELGFIDYAPHATAQYEMTRPFAELMANLLREYRLTSVEVIRSYFTAMDNLADEIREAVADKKADLLVNALRDTAEHVERMRHDSRRNREGVVATAMQVKSNKGRIPARRRYEIINRLWNRYIVPLRDMIDTEKHMDASLDRMDGMLVEAAERFEADDAVAPRVRAARDRIRRLRREVGEDFHESIREITPLYEELRRENALARGASHALERIGKDGLSSLNIPQTLCVCNWQQRGLFSDGALEAYLHTLKGYSPTRPDPLRRVEVETEREHVRLDRFDSTVARSLPIRDALEWLADSYPEASLSAVLRFYGRLHSGRYGPTDFGSDERDYDFEEAVLTAHPMQVEGDDDEE